MRWRLLQVLFAISGACALGYEVVWGRLLVNVLGGTTIATSAVLTSYMGGLGLGSWVAGRYSGRTRSPLRAYAFVELGIALLALGFAPLANHIVGAPASFRFGCALLVLVFPTFLMGGTVPLVMAWSESEGLPRGETLGRLYGVNTLGAAVGCLLTGFLLVPVVGLELTNIVWVAGNLIIALVVLFLARAPSTDRPVVDAGPTRTNQPVAATPLLFLAFASGLATLGLEVLWIRLLRITLGSTTYVFTLVVTAYVLGIGLGGLWAGRVREERNVLKRLTGHQLALVLLLLIQFVLLPRTPFLFNALRSAFPGWDGGLVGSAILCLVALLPVTFVSGVTFPLLGRLFLQRGTRGGQAGLLYAVNTGGAVVGALATSLILVPAMGSARAFALLIGVAVVALFVYARLARSVSLGWVSYAAVPLAIISTTLGISRPGWTSAYLAHGAYLPPRSEAVQTVVFQEGANSTVLVEKFGSELGMAVDGKPEASTAYVDRANQILLGHLPALLVPQTNSALVIGLGSGMTLGMLSIHHPSTLEVCELESRMRDAALAFGDWNHHVMDLPGFAGAPAPGAAGNRMVVDDGLNYLLSTESRYDVVTSDPIQPFFRGAAGLYTEEFFSRAKAKLTPDGVMAHWLPLANMDDADFRMIVRTFAHVFPYARLYWTGGFADTILVGRTVPWSSPAIDAAAFARAKPDLESIFIDSPDQLEGLLIADRDLLLDWAGDGPLNRLDSPKLEFSAPKSVFANTVDHDLGELMAMRRATGDRDRAKWRSAEWRAGNVMLSYRSRIEHLADKNLGDRLLTAALGCRGFSECPLVDRSGLVRRALFERAMAKADRALEAHSAITQVSGSWWVNREASGVPIDDERGLAAALADYSEASALVAPSRADEVQMYGDRIDLLKRLVPPDSPNGKLLGKLMQPTNEP